MFLGRNNKIRWKWIGWAAVVVAALIAMGIMWFDVPMYLFLRQFDCRLWSVLDMALGTKMWLIGAALVVLMVYIKKAINTKIQLKNNKGKFSSRAFLIDGFNKIKNSNAFLVLCSVLLSALVGGVIKVVVGRARPIFFEALDMTGFFPFTFDWAFNSMPSGHTMAAFSGLVMLGMLVPRIKPLTWTTAIIIGVSRVCIGAHWPTDVIFGAFIGMLAADFVLALHHRRCDAVVAKN